MTNFTVVFLTPFFDSGETSEVGSVLSSRKKRKLLTVLYREIALVKSSQQTHWILGSFGFNLVSTEILPVWKEHFTSQFYKRAAVACLQSRGDKGTDKSASCGANLA